MRFSGNSFIIPTNKFCGPFVGKILYKLSIMCKLIDMENVNPEMNYLIILMIWNQFSGQKINAIIIA